MSKSQGSSLSKMHTNRSYDTPYIEADAAKGLVCLRLKVKFINKFEIQTFDFLNAKNTNKNFNI